MRLQNLITRIFRSSSVVSSTNGSMKGPHDRMFMLIPVSLGIGMAIYSFSVSDEGSSRWVVPLSIVVVSIVMGWFLQLRHARTIERLLEMQSESRARDSEFYSKVLPVWTRHIDSSREIGDKAVEELTDLFGDIVGRLGSMLKISNAGRSVDGGLVGVIKESQDDFRSVFEDLKTALKAVNDSKEMIIAEVKRYSKDMRDISADAQNLAMKSKMIAINAEIEAAHVGDAGSAFSEVVSEMRALSEQTAKSSAIMTKKVEAIDEEMARFYHDEAQLTEMEEAHVSKAETVFDEIVLRLSSMAVDLEHSVNEMESESRNVRSDISSALVALQFQDRLSQILAHVAENIAELNGLLGGGVRGLDADEWLREMESRYSVDEEYGGSRASNNVKNEPGLLTYF